MLLVPLKDTTLETLLWYCFRILNVNGLKVEGPVQPMSWLQWFQYLFTIFLVSFYYHGGYINNYIHNDDPQIPVGVCTMGAGFMAINKARWLYMKRHEIAEVIDLARIVEKSTPGPAKDLRRAQVTSLAFGWTAALAGFILLVRPILAAGRSLPDEYVTLPGLHPPTTTPNYEISFVIIGLMVFFAICISSGYRMLFAALVEHCAARTRLLAYHLRNINLFDDGAEVKVGNENLNRDLGQLISRHLEILDLADKMRSTFDSVMGLDFALTSAACCTLLMQTENTGTMYTVQYISYVFCEILMYCYCGQHLIDASRDLEYAAYDCGWESWEATSSTKRSVVMILLSTQRPLMLTAFKKFALSYDTFQAIMRGCYTLVTAVNAKNV